MNQATTRMTLNSVRTGKRPAPDRVVLVGTDGIGKSTFAADAPKPIFLAAEDGIRQIDVASFPEPETLADVYDAIRTLSDEDHPYQTLVVDTLDWLEPLIYASVCERNRWENIESPGYGKGYVIAAEEWRRLLAALEKCRAVGMQLILLAHAQVKNFNNPAGDDFMRYEVALSKQGGALVKQWADSVLFANYEEFIQADPDKPKARKKGLSTGRRLIHTVRTSAWDAKNRYGMPDVLPLSWAEYAAARDAGLIDRGPELRVIFATLIAELGEDHPKRQQIIDFVGDMTDITKLERTVDRMRELVNESEAGP